MSAILSVATKARCRQRRDVTVALAGLHADSRSAPRAPIASSLRALATRQTPANLMTEAVKNLAVSRRFQSNRQSSTRRGDGRSSRLVFVCADSPLVPVVE